MLPTSFYISNAVQEFTFTTRVGHLYVDGRVGVLVDSRNRSLSRYSESHYWIDGSQLLEDNIGITNIHYSEQRGPLLQKRSG